MHRWTEEHKDFIRSVAPGKYNPEIAELFNDKFGTNLSAGQIKSFKSNHKIRSGVPRFKFTGDEGLFTKEQKAFIKENVKGLLNKELADLLNETFNLSVTAGQMNAYKKNHGLTGDIDCRFKKGEEPWNKGLKGIDCSGVNGKKTQFKKGQKPHNYLPVGTELVNGDGYVDIKIADPNVWKAKHILVWEKAYGPKPEGHAIIFGDRNNRNFDLDNLILVSAKRLLTLNRYKLIKGNADLTKTGVIVGELIERINESKEING